MNILLRRNERLFVLVDASARTGKRIEGRGDGRVLGAYGRDEFDGNGKHPLAFASDNKLALMHMFFSVSYARVEYLIRSTASAARNEPRGTDCILARQAHRSRVCNVKVHPQPPPPAKADSDHNIVCAIIRLLSGRSAPNRHARTKKQSSAFRPAEVFDLTETAGSE